MRKLALVIAATLLAMAAASARSSVVQIEPRFEYARITPRAFPVMRGQVSYQPVGYRACVAAGTEWTCRDFDPNESSEAAVLPTVLATLGREGWELVSVANPSTDGSYFQGFTYVFKRQLR